MADFNEMNNGIGDVVSGVDTVKKKKGGGLVIAAGLLAGVVAVGAGGGIAAYSLSDFVKNQVKLRVSKPENYYAWVNEKNSADFSAALSEKYGVITENASKGSKSAVSVKWDISDDVKEKMIDEVFGSDTDDLDEETQNVIDVLNNLSSAKLGITSNSKASAVNSSAYLEVNDNRILTVENALTLEPLIQFSRIPELNEQWLGLETNVSELDEDERDFIEACKKIMENPEYVLSPKELEQEIDRYVGVWNSSTEDVQIEKKEEVTIGDITVNYTVATVEIDNEKARDIAGNLINSFKEDDILKAVLTDRTGAMTEEEYDSDLDEALKVIEGDIDSDSDTKVTVKTYIDPKGDIRGVDFILSENQDGTMELCFMTGKDGDQIRGEFFAKENGEEEFRIDLTAVENGKKYTGDIDITMDDEKASVEFTDIETVNEEKGYVNGALTFVIPDTDPVSLTLNSDGSSQKISTEIVVDNTNYGKVTLEYSADEAEAPEIPDKKDAFMVDPEDYDFEITDYVTEDNVNGFIVDVIEKLGFDKTNAKDIADGLTGTLFHIYDYDDYDDWDYDDWDNDFDGDDWDLDYDEDFDDDIDDDDWGDFDLDLNTEPNFAYIYVADKGFKATRLGGYGTLSTGAVDAKIEGNGTYTVSLSASGNVSPNGLNVLSLNIDEMTFGGSPAIKVTSLKIDGKDVPFTSEPEALVGGDYISVPLYADESLFSVYDNTFDGAAIGDWKKIEITFEVSGIE